MSIRRRGMALLAVCAILATVVLGFASTASAQSYTPPSQLQNSGIQANQEAQAQAPLARTGSNSTIPVAEFGVALLMAGGFLLIISRKRAEHARVAATS